jgi:hypothetical protein
MPARAMLVGRTPAELHRALSATRDALNSAKGFVRKGLGAALAAAWAFSAPHVSAHDLRTLAAPQAPTPNRCASIAPAPPFAPPDSAYQRRYDTIAHRFLADEKEVSNVTVSMYAILDRLIDEADVVLKPLPSGLSESEKKKFAIESLTAIDCLLLRHAFVYPGHGLVGLLSDGLGPTVYTTAHDRDELRTQQHNIRRSRFIDAFGSGPFYVMDCDIASYLYLAIAEIMKYPLHLVEIPRHNFIRWELGQGVYVDFETMDGMETDDDYYKTRWFIPDAFVGRGGILKSMTVAETVAYHWATIAISWSWQLNVTRMIESYQKSLAIDFSHALALNNLAWFYAAAPRSEWRDSPEALKYGIQTVALVPDGDSLDTLACAYAQNGDFSWAIETEQDAMNAGYTPFGSNLRGDMALFKAEPPQACNDPTFGQDPAPFRPRQAITRAATDKDLLRLH